MYTELSLKLKALTLAVMINGLIMGSAAFLFDGQLHQERNAQVARSMHLDATRVHASVFRP
jgi:hypothetical protein